MSRTKVIIMGAAGRDFHNFNTVYRDNERYEVVAFTATQIPKIGGRTYPPELAGSLYPQGIPIHGEDKLEELVDQVDIVTYNPEHWEYTPTDEQENLVETVQRAAEFAHTRGLRFMFAPDRRFAEAHLGEVAPYVDAVLLQGQRIQHDPPAFASWVLPMISIARSANPEIQVYVQVGATRGTALEMFTAIQTVANDIDGIAVWSMPRTLDILQEFVTLLQGSPAAFAPTPPPSTTGSPATTVPTLASAPSSTRIPTSQSSMAIDTPHLVTAQTSPVAIVAQTQVPSEISTATLTPTLTALRASQSSGAAATADKINSISTPTATVTEEALLAQVTPLKVAAESLLPTTAPPLLSLAPEFEQAVETCDWLENSSSILVGVIIGLAAGMAGGVLLGFGLGRKQGGEKPS